MIIHARQNHVAVVLSLAVLLCAALPLSAQEAENLDDLFSDPVEDTVVVETQTDHLAQYVTSDTVVISGSFNATGGAIAGWTQWPDPANLETGYDGTIGLTTSATLNIDARPDPDFHLYGTMSTSMNPLDPASGVNWSSFALGEFFVDYTWLGNVFIRMGKHSITWGQGRLFSGSTNIMSDTYSGFALRASLPTLLDGVSAIGLLKSEYFESGTLASYKQICYAVKADQVLLGTLLSLGGRYQVDEGINAILSVKRTILGVDLLADVVLHDNEASRYYQVLAGFFKEWTDFKVYGEYYYTGATVDVPDHSAGLACGFNNVFGTPIDVGAQWIHAFIDGSGTVTAGLTWVPWKFITAKIGVPVVYGEEGSRYVVALATTDPGKRRVSLAFGLEMAVSF